VDWNRQPHIDRDIAPGLERGSDLGLPMRLLSISLLVFASSAFAQSPPSVDCNAVKNSELPFELSFHGQDGTRTLTQIYRDKSGDDVVWSRETLPSTQPNPPVFVTKATYVDRMIASAEMSTTFAGKYSHRTANYTPEGLPKNFDRRSDVTFKMHAVIKSADGITEEKTSTISYKFKSEETTAVGSCVLQVIHGEIDTTDDAGRTRHRFQVYFPELRSSATASDAEPIVDGLSTVFSGIKPLN
jgi:hypothetical protein